MNIHKHHIRPVMRNFGQSRFGVRAGTDAPMFGGAINELRQVLAEGRIIFDYRNFRHSVIAAILCTFGMGSKSVKCRMSAPAHAGEILTPKLELHTVFTGVELISELIGRMAFPHMLH
jgi:hypothetical protein